MRMADLVLFASLLAVAYATDEIRHAQPAAMTIAEVSCGVGFGRREEPSAPARSATVFPEWAGCAETWETKPDDAPPLVLRCRRGSISAIEEAVLGRPSGRCEPAAFLFPSEDERQQLAVEYARPADQGLCDAVDFRRVAAADCVGKASCALHLRHILTATNTHPGSCHGLLLRAAARFRCGTEKNRLEGGEGHRDVAWFDEDLTRTELAEAIASEELSRGYAIHDPVYSAAGSSKNPVACGFGFEGDFVNVVCDGSAALERLPADVDALDAFENKADAQSGGNADGTLRITEVVAARYGTFDGECHTKIDLKNPASFPEMMCGVDVADYASAQCVGKRSCIVYSPPLGIGRDPCPSEKKALMIVARCAP